MLSDDSQTDHAASSIGSALRPECTRTSPGEIQWPSNQEAIQSVHVPSEVQHNIKERDIAQQMEGLSSLIDRVCERSTASEHPQPSAHFDVRELDDLYRNITGRGTSWLVKSAIGRQVSAKNFLKALISTYLAREVFKPDTEHSWDMYGAPAWRHIVQLLPSITDEARALGLDQDDATGSDTIARRAYGRDIGSPRFQAALSVTAETMAESLAGKLYQQLCPAQGVQLNEYLSRQTLFDCFDGLDLALKHALNINCKLSSLDGGYEVIWAFPRTAFDPAVMRRDEETPSDSSGAVLITTFLGLRQDGRVVVKATVMLACM